jgi:hypothetical protein
MRTKYFVFLIFFLILFISSQNLASSQVYKPFEISDVTFAPKFPNILDEMNISVEVRNNFERGQDLKLSIFVLKEGIVAASSENNFFLDSKKTKTIPFSYTTQNVGEHQIMFKLFKKGEDVEQHSKILNFSVSSEFGPFDISLNTLSENVEPGTKIPLILRTANNGEEGTDLDVKITMKCNRQPDMVNEFVFYLEGKKEDQRVVVLPTCQKEEGLHTIFAEMMFYNKTLLSSLSQFYLAENPYKLIIDTNQLLQVTPEIPFSFDVNVRNPNNVSADNVRLAISNLPSSWYEIKPPSIKKIEPNETVVFIVNLNIPTSASSDSYSLTLFAASTKTIEKTPIELKLSKATSFIGKSSLYQNSLFMIFIILVPTVLVALGVWYFIRNRPKNVVFNE